MTTVKTPEINKLDIFNSNIFNTKFLEFLASTVTVYYSSYHDKCKVMTVERGERSQLIGTSY